MTNGYYYSQFDSVSIDCYDAPSDAQVNGSNSYVLTKNSQNEGDFAITNDPTILGSFLASNLDPDYGASSSVSGGASKTANTVPGMTGAGPGSDNHAGDTTGSSTSQASQATGSKGSGSGSAASGFVQGSGDSSGASANVQPEKALSGSLFAVVVAIVGLCIL